MDILKVTIRAVGVDRYAGLTGHAYIAARGLTPRPNHSVTNCKHCAQQEMLPAVQLICAAAHRIGAPAKLTARKPMRIAAWR